MAKKRCSKKCLAIALVIILAAVAAILAQSTHPKACTLEAKLCPDGSAVGRVLPNCEFAPCKTECQSDADCVPMECCHPTQCINNAYKEDCSNIGCSAVCEGPLDCGAGSCGCVNNLCAVIPK